MSTNELKWCANFILKKYEELLKTQYDQNFYERLLEDFSVHHAATFKLKRDAVKMTETLKDELKTRRKVKDFANRSGMEVKQLETLKKMLHPQKKIR